MTPDTKVFRTVRSQIALAGAFSLACLVTLGVLTRKGVGGVAITACSLVAVLAVAAFAHALTTRVALQADGLEIVANFRRRFLPRGLIESVTWDRGSGGVSVKLVGGFSLKLPETGHDNQVRGNCIRAWLKNTGAPSGSTRHRADA